MENKLGWAIISAAITYAVIRFGAGTVAFKPGLDVEVLQANAPVYAWIGAAVVFGLALVISAAPGFDERDE